MTKKCIFLLSCVLLLASGLGEVSPSKFLDYANSMLEGSNIEVDESGINAKDGYVFPITSEEMTSLYTESNDLALQIEQMASDIKADGVVSDQENTDFDALTSQWFDQIQQDSQETQELLINNISQSISPEASDSESSQ